MTTRSSIATGFAAAVLLALSVSSPAAAAPVCGDTITQDTTLNADILNCAAGLTIGADNVTLNLNGHTIGGNGPGFPTGSGIHANGRRNITIRNGRTEDFIFGMTLVNVTQSTVRNVTADDNNIGMFLSNVDRSLIVGSEWSSSAVYGMRIANGSDDNHLRGNFGERNVAQATILEGSSRNVLRDNEMILGPIGFQIANGSLTNRLVDNTATDHFIAGFFIGFGAAAGTVLRGNQAHRNLGDGIRVIEPATTLTRNDAHDNGDLGIEAAPGVTDGGHNTARGNGNPAQCLKVVCGP